MPNLGSLRLPHYTFKIKNTSISVKLYCQNEKRHSDCPVLLYNTTIDE